MTPTAYKHIADMSCRDICAVWAHIPQLYTVTSRRQPTRQKYSRSRAVGIIDIDAIVEVNEKTIGVEVDGPYHFIGRSSPTGAAQF